MKTIFTLLLLCFTTFAFSQTTISGKVVDERGNPVSGANVFMEGTFNGYELLASDYWFSIDFGDGKLIKGHFSLKR